jgi:carbonic anhydrase
MIDQLLTGNRQFMETEFAPNAEYYRSIASGAKVVADRVAEELGLSREQKLELLTAENVKLQTKHRKNLALIENQHAKGSLPRIYGWLYRVETGTIDVLVDGRDGATA